MKEHQAEELINQLRLLNMTMERIADDLDTIIAGVTVDTLKQIGRGIQSFLDGVLNDVEITNGKET